MFEPLWGAGRALGAYSTALAVVADNLANLSTAGFTARRTLFAEYLGEARSRPPGYLVPPGSALEAVVQTLPGQGTLQPTGRPWDVGIAGPGYFVLRLHDGRVAYTRSGAFSLDARGRLTGPEGALVLREDGGLLEPLAGEVRPGLRSFANPGGLLHLGNGLYLPTAASGPPRPAPAGTRVREGYLEVSQTDLTAEMSALLVTQRAFQFVARGLDTHDQMLALANRLKGP